MEGLTQKADLITSLLHDHRRNRHAIDEAFALLDVDFRIMALGATGDFLGEIKKARKSIACYKASSAKPESEARDVKVSLSIVLATLTHERKVILVGG
ncbi:hypothetical protein I5T99_16055 [Stenotrophomonas maltophilia]|nr:hypothetical protein [Stenotrophomonas maltophilia]